MDFKVATLEKSFEEEIKRIEKKISTDIGRPIALVAYEPEQIETPIKGKVYTTSGLETTKKAGE